MYKNKMREEYLNNLFKQFRSAVKLEGKLDSSYIIEEFSKWLEQNRIHGDLYTMVLEQIGVPYKTSDVAEIGKGDKDSVVLGNEKTTLITPFNLKSTKNPVIKAEFYVSSKSQLLIEDKDNEVIYTPVSYMGIKRVMTQNPYSYRMIEKWKNIQDIGITVGVYGSLYDKDMTEKINLLRKLKTTLVKSSEFIEKYIELYDSYYYVISTNNKVKKIER